MRPSTHAADKVSGRVLFIQLRGIQGTIKATVVQSTGMAADAKTRYQEAAWPGAKLLNALSIFQKTHNIMISNPYQSLQPLARFQTSFG